MTSLEHRLPIESWGLMKIVIISDIHANFEALQSLPEDDYDELWCLGDLVDYGPRPLEVSAVANLSEVAHLPGEPPSGIAVARMARHSFANLTVVAGKSPFFIVVALFAIAIVVAAIAFAASSLT